MLGTPPSARPSRRQPPHDFIAHLRFLRLSIRCLGFSGCLSRGLACRVLVSGGHNFHDETELRLYHVLVCGHDATRSLLSTHIAMHCVNTVGLVAPQVQSIRLDEYALGEKAHTAFAGRSKALASINDIYAFFECTLDRVGRDVKAVLVSAEYVETGFGLTGSGFVNFIVGQLALGFAELTKIAPALGNELVVRHLGVCLAGLLPPAPNHLAEIPWFFGQAAG